VESQQELSKPQRQGAGRRCSMCAAFPRLATEFLDPRTGRTVRLYECECGELSWDD
jgi:hypothetical protein